MRYKIIFCRKNLFYLLLIFSLLSSCERHSYTLLDPATAGEMTLFTTSDGLPSNEAADIKPDSRGNLWFTFPGYGMARLNDNGWTFYTSGQTPLLSNAVTVLEKTAGGGILVGTSDGLSILSGSNVWSSFTDVSVGTLYISAMKVAANGWIWVGTQNQGFYINTGSGFVRSLFFQNANIHSIEEGDSGNIYLATDSGIIRFNGSAYSVIKVSDGLPRNRIKALRFDSSKRLWIGPDGGNNAAWIDKNGIHKLDLMTGADSITINAIHEDRRGYLWFATDANGLVRYNGIIPFSYKKDLNGFPENRINCIGEDKYGNLWFGLGSKGVVRYTLPLEK